MAIDTPNKTAKVLSNKNANVAPSMTGNALYRVANAIHTSWLLSPISAANMSKKLELDTVVTSNQFKLEKLLVKYST